MYPEVCLRFRWAKEKYWEPDSTGSTDGNCIKRNSMYTQLTCYSWSLGRYRIKHERLLMLKGRNHWVTEKTNQGLGTKSSPCNSFTARSAEGTQRWPHKAASKHTMESAQLHCIKALWLSSNLQHKTTSLQQTWCKTKNHELTHQKKCRT